MGPQTKIHCVLEARLSLVQQPSPCCLFTGMRLAHCVRKCFFGTESPVSFAIVTLAFFLIRPQQLLG